MSDENMDSGVHSEAAAPANDGQHDSQTGESEKAQHVPLEALQAERAQRQSLQEELQVIKDHLSLLRASQEEKAAQSQSEEYSDDDVLTYGDFKKALSKKEQQIKVTIDELRMMQKHSDYEEVITQYLPEILKENPGLRRTLQETQNYELAYYLAKNSDNYRKNSTAKKRNADAERIVKNSQQSGSLSSVGSNAAVNQSRRYKDMNDDDFQKLVSRNLGYR